MHSGEVRGAIELEYCRFIGISRRVGCVQHSLFSWLSAPMEVTGYGFVTLVSFTLLASEARMKKRYLDKIES